MDTLQDGEWKYAGAAQVGAGEVCEIRFQKPLAYMIHYLIPDYPDGSGWYFDSHQPEEDTVLMLMPFQVTLLPTYLLSKRLGIYDTLWALILPDVFSPMGVFLIWEFMKSIPDETMEAAYLETDSNCRVLCSIVLPAVRPGIVTAGVLHFAESWNRIEQPLILLQSEWRYPLSLRLSLLSESTIGIRFAGSVLFMAPAVLLYFLLRDEITESIKFPAGTR